MRGDDCSQWLGVLWSCGRCGGGVVVVVPPSLLLSSPPPSRRCPQQEGMTAGRRKHHTVPGNDEDGRRTRMGKQQGGDEDAGRARMGERRGVAGMMMMTEHTTRPQPHEQLLMGWAVGGMMMMPTTAPWTTAMSHCSWGGRGVLMRYG